MIINLLAHPYMHYSTKNEDACICECFAKKKNIYKQDFAVLTEKRMVLARKHDFPFWQKIIKFWFGGLTTILRF